MIWYGILCDIQDLSHESLAPRLRLKIRQLTCDIGGIWARVLATLGHRSPRLEIPSMGEKNMGIWVYIHIYIYIYVYMYIYIYTYVYVSKSSQVNSKSSHSEAPSMIILRLHSHPCSRRDSRSRRARCLRSRSSSHPAERGATRPTDPPVSSNTTIESALSNAGIAIINHSPNHHKWVA